MSGLDLSSNAIFAAQVVLFNKWLKEGGSFNLMIENWTFFGMNTHHVDACYNFD